jgi:hypothetical protein
MFNFLFQEKNSNLYRDSNLGSLDLYFLSYPGSIDGTGLKSPYPVLTFFPFFSLPDVLCDPIDLISRKGTPFDAIIGCTALSSDGLLAEVFRGFPQP